jgi:hypothetical protein
VVAVFGQVSQVAEISEGADHTDSAVAGQSFEGFFKGLVGFLVGVTPEGHRQLAYLLDQLEGLCAFLGSDDIPQNAA